MGYQENFQLQNLILPNNIFYAPLAGCSDYPFRQMATLFKPGLMFCEMVKIEAVIRKDPTTLKYLEYHSSMRPIGAQICGSNPKVAAEAAKIIEDLGFDVIDLNCGCPVDKVIKDGSGSALLMHPEKIAEMLLAIKSVVSIPVTAKVRLGWNQDNITIFDVLSHVEESGASLITIHGRTRQQGYSGVANWEYIKECKRRAKKILVFGNGDIFDPDAAKRIFQETECDGIMVARGMLGKPWLAEDIIHSFQGKNTQKKSFIEHLDML
ncbi:MAG: tRNA dihydrouridine synthase DusB, partial [Chlamydiota bacterium]